MYRAKRTTKGIANQNYLQQTYLQWAKSIAEEIGTTIELFLQCNVGADALRSTGVLTVDGNAGIFFRKNYQGGKLELSRLCGANVTSHSAYFFMHVNSQWKLERWGRVTCTCKSLRCMHFAFKFYATVCKFVWQLLAQYLVAGN